MEKLPGLDYRTNLYRDDAASSTLRHRIMRDRYLDGKVATIHVPACNAHADADPGSEVGTQFLYGEIVDVYEEKNDWAWCQSRLDNYVGYIRVDSFKYGSPARSHRVIVPLAHCYHEPNPRSTVACSLPINARLSISARIIASSEPEVKFFQFDDQLWIQRQSVSEHPLPSSEFITLAKEFVGTPYLWGGKTKNGIDCSGLIQVSLHACGRPCPRDSNQQCSVVGEVVLGGRGDARFGDIIYLPGHVGFYLGEGKFLHADGIDKIVKTQSLDEVVNLRSVNERDLIVRRLTS